MDDKVKILTDNYFGMQTNDATFSYVPNFDARKFRDDIPSSILS